MNHVPADTAPEVEVELTRRMASLSGAERIAMASAMFETARRLIFASRPDLHDPHQRRLLLLERLYPELDVPADRIP